MPTTHELKLAGETLVATAERALWWPREQMLLLADLHAGKAGHFRRYGVAVPGDLLAADLARLAALIYQFQPKRVLVLGDLFHSETNAEWESLSTWVAQWPKITFELVRGNHDRFFATPTLVTGGWTVHEEAHQVGPFWLRHEPYEVSEIDDGSYAITGHLHPAVQVRGRGHESLRRPCFWASARQLVLPAFGHFTGALTIKPLPGDNVLVVGQRSLVRLPL